MLGIWRRAQQVLGEHFALLVILFVLLLLAGISYLQSRPDPSALQDRAAQLLNEIRKLQSQQADDAQLISLMMRELMTSDRRSYWVDVLERLSFAFLISFILILAVDIHTRRIARRDLKKHIEAVEKNVWTGVGKRLVGDKITREIDAILQLDVAKEDCHYVFRFKDPARYAGTPPDRVVVVMENWYKLRNLTGRETSLTVRTALKGFENVAVREDGKECVLPRYISLKIDDVDIPIEQGLDPNKPGYLSHVVNLPEDQRQRRRVYLAAELIYRTRDSETVITATPIEHLDVSIHNEVPNLVRQFKLEIMHPAFEKKEHPAEGTWSFPGTLLPGQGFHFSWEP